MKTSRMILLSMLMAGLATAGCKKDKGGEGGAGGGGGAPAPTEPAAAPAKLAELDLSSVGEDYAGWKIMAPEGATAKDDFGAIGVKAGDGFQLEIHTGDINMAERKKEIESNDINKLKGYLTDTADTLVYESEVMSKKEVHLLAVHKVGDVAVYCENTKGPTYNKAQIEAMLAACKSLKK
jgi:hypothetical protein